MEERQQLGNVKVSAGMMEGEYCFSDVVVYYVGGSLLSLLTMFIPLSIG